MQARGNVEAWLSQVEQSMAVSLRKLARAAHQAYPTMPRTQGVTLHPSQLVILISQVKPHPDMSQSTLVTALGNFEVLA